MLISDQIRPWPRHCRPKHLVSLPYKRSRMIHPVYRSKEDRQNTRKEPRLVWLTRRLYCKMFQELGIRHICYNKDSKLNNLASCIVASRVQIHIYIEDQPLWKLWCYCLALRICIRAKYSQKLVFQTPWQRIGVSCGISRFSGRSRYASYMV